jgi:ATP-dependent RNA helicase SUPV3L1/SUV3
MIYGSLPYDVRHREAERFASGETDVVVATDAIGMGMNLPIRRVVLLEQTKFDGHERRLLTGAEIQQIVGRAGRYGIHEAGGWISANENKKMGRLMSAEPSQIAYAPIGFVRTLLEVDGTVSELMGRWSSMAVDSPFSKMPLERETKLATDLEGCLSPGELLDPRMKTLVYRFAVMPFKEHIEWLRHKWLEMFSCEVTGRPFPIEVPSGGLPHGMEDLEAQYAYLDLLHQYCRTFGYVQHYDDIDERRRLISNRISEMIAGNVFEPKRCRECGKILPWNWPYPMCDPCHERLFRHRHWYD